MHLRVLLVVALLFPAFAVPVSAAPPAIEAIYPSVAPPGAPFKIVGSGFEGVTQVGFGSAAANFTLENGTIYARVPYVAAGSYDVTVVDDEGSATWCCFEVTEPTPQIESWTPERVVPGQRVWVSGRDLDLVTGVSVGGFNASFEASRWSLRFYVPENTSFGFHLVEFAHAGGVVRRCCLEIIDPDEPRFDALHPEIAAPFDLVTVSGDNLRGLRLLFLWGPEGGIVPEIVWASEWSITFRVPVVAAGSYGVIAYFDKDNGNVTREASICCLVVDPTLPRPDVAVEIVKIEKSTIRTDFTDPVTNPRGIQKITVRVDNLGDAAARPSQLHVGVVQNGLGYDGTWWSVAAPRLEAGASAVFTFEWDPGDVVGDATVRAHVESGDFSNDPSNDRDEEETFVLVGGLGSANVPLVY